MLANLWDHIKGYIIIKIAIAALLSAFSLLSHAQDDLEAPEGLRVEIIEDDETKDVLIRWNFPSPEPSNFQGFNIYRNGNKINGILWSDTAWLDDDQLPLDSTYIYQTEAVYNNYADTSDRSARGIVTLREGYYFEMGSGDGTGNTWDVYLDLAMVGEAVASPGDELIIMDGDLIVGQTILKKQPYPGNNPPDVVINYQNIETGSGLDGYTPGNPYTFKLYDASMDRVYENYDDTLIQVDSNAYIGEVFPEGNNKFSFAQLEFHPQLSAPQIQDISNENHYVTLSWNHNINQRDFIGYNVFRNNSKQNNQPIGELTYTNDSVPSGQYNYHVEAVYDENHSVSSDTTSITIETVFYEPIIAPDDTINPMKCIIEEAEIMNASLQLFDEIGVFKYMPGDTVCIAAKSLTGSLNGNSKDTLFLSSDNSFTDSIEGFQTGDTLYFHLYNYENAIEYKRALVATSQNGTNEILTFTPDTDTNVYLNWMPLPPQNLSATVEEYDVNLAWNENPENTMLTLDGYNIYREGQQINDTPVGEPTYLDESLLVDEYSYRVEAVYEEAVSPMSDSLAVTIPMQQFIPESQDPSAGTMDFFITEAVIDDQDLSAFDEIGVFAPTDTGMICVGSNSLHEDISSENPLHIVAYQDNSSGGQNGFLPEDSISYKLWKQTSDNVYASIEYSFSYPPEEGYNFEAFSTADTCFVNLSFTSPPPVEFAYQTFEYCEDQPGDIYVNVNNFNNISGFQLEMIMDTSHYHFSDVEAVPDFIEMLDVTNNTDTLVVFWTADSVHSLEDGASLLQINIYADTAGEANIGWDTTSMVNGMEYQGANFFGTGFTIGDVPSAPSQIYGNSQVCQGNEYSIYTISGLPDANSYTWGIAPDNAGDLNPDGETAYVYWNPDFESTATLSVAGVNECGTGGAASKEISVQDVVNVDITIEKSPDDPCEDNTIIFTSDAQGGGNNPTYEWYVNGVKQEGEDSDTFAGTDFQDEDEVYCKFTSSSDCADNNPATSNTIELQIDPLPATPQEILGNTMMCNTIQQTEYTTLDLSDTDSYQWTAQPSQAYDSIQCLNDNPCQTITIFWNANWLNPGEVDTVLLWVRGINEECGPGQYINPPLNIIQDYCTPTESSQAGGLSYNLYPNPAGEILYLEVRKPDEIQWSLLSVSGKVIKHGNPTGHRTPIDTSPLPRGIYFLKVQTAERVYMNKVIKE